MDYYLIIKPTFNCYLELEENTIILKKNRLNPILISTDENFISLSILSYDNTSSLPFSLSLRLKEGVLTNTHHNAELISFSNNTLLLLLRPFLEFTPSYLDTQTKTVFFGGIAHTIHYLKNDYFNIRIENAENYIDQKYNKKIVNLNTKTINDTLFIYCKTNTQSYVIMTVSFKNNTYTTTNLEEVDLLEHENNKILTFNALFDLAKHGVTKEYSFEKNFSEKASLVSVYDSLKKVTKKELIPYAFFDAVRVENYTLAREYLAESLKTKLKDEHLKHFFGDFIMYSQSLTPSSPLNQIALIYEKNDKKQAKEFLVSQDEFGLITNINEI